MHLLNESHVLLTIPFISMSPAHCPPWMSSREVSGHEEDVCVCMMLCVPICCREYVSTTYALNAGYVQVAEVNDIIVLFPQVTNNISDGSNPSGCWDW